MKTFRLISWRILLGLWVAVSVSVSVSGAQAGVSPRNGNFFTGNLDMAYPGGFNLEIKRVYNSKASYRGMWGHGWGSALEAYIQPEADGTVTIHEYGGGAENRFYPINGSAEELKRVITQLMDYAKLKGKVAGTAANFENYANRLKSDRNFRNQEWISYLSAGRGKMGIENGEQFLSRKFQSQYLTKVKEGFLRVYKDGRIDRFNVRGQLAMIQNPDSSYLILQRNNRGLITALKDNLNRRMELSYSNSGNLVFIKGEAHQRVEYRYNNRDELVLSQDYNDQVFTYNYSSDGKHLLTQINSYGVVKDLKIFNTEKGIKSFNPRVEKIAYFNAQKNENVRRHVDEDGTITDYDYIVKMQDAGYSGIRVTLREKNETVISSVLYEYHNKKNSRGEDFTWKYALTLDGQREETVYEEMFNLPTKITRGIGKAARSTIFRYDHKGRLVYKQTQNEIIRNEFHPKIEKIWRYSNYDARTRKLIGWTQFGWDLKTGNLISAQNSRKEMVRLFYSEQTKLLSALTDAKKRQFFFNWDPVTRRLLEIKIAKQGSLQIKYNAAGQPIRADSPEGRQIASTVKSALDDFTLMLQPSGVNLGF